MGEIDRPKSAASPGPAREINQRFLAIFVVVMAFIAAGASDVVIDVAVALVTICVILAVGVGLLRIFTRPVKS